MGRFGKNEVVAVFHVILAVVILVISSKMLAKSQIREGIFKLSV